MASLFKVNKNFADHEAVIRELTRGYELTEQLQAQAMHILRDDGRAKAAAFLLQEVSRAFTVCLSILNSSSKASAGTSNAGSLLGRDRRRVKEDNSRRKRMVTSAPHHDGYQWRKYGQKKILNSKFPRCYYRCTYHRDHNCPATKQVQLQHDSNPPSYLVVYAHEHTCNRTFDSDPTTSGKLLDFSATTQPHFHLLDHGIKGEQEREALVSSLASIIGGYSSGKPELQNSRTGLVPDHSASMEVSEPILDEISSSAPSLLPRMDDGWDLDNMMIDWPCFESYDMLF